MKLCNLKLATVAVAVVRVVGEAADVSPNYKIAYLNIP